MRQARRATALLAGALLLVSGIHLAAPAAAADDCLYVGSASAELPAANFNATKVRLGITALDITGVLSVPPECEGDLISWEVNFGQGVVFTDQRPTVRFDPKKLRPGVNDSSFMKLRWVGGEAPIYTNFFSHLYKRTTFGGSFNAVGEPLKSGGPLYLKATLGVADWKSGNYVPYRGRTVRVQWRAAGENTWATYGKVLTDDKGRVRDIWTSDASGTWRLQYGGNQLAAGADSNADYVGIVAP